MATAARIHVVNSPQIHQFKVDYQEKCRCGHYRFEHHTSFGCMQWDERRSKGWCDCEGFAVRTPFSY